ncbi:hypothetical protein [Desulfitobacterium chlororespirans]|nr:hypothetical protein [Desulfitobacterium chlororespirans]
MSELLKLYQGMIFEMYLAGKLFEDEFDILSALSEGMEADGNVVELVSKVMPDDLKDSDIADCIRAKQFRTALTILD